MKNHHVQKNTTKITLEDKKAIAREIVDKNMLMGRDKLAKLHDISISQAKHILENKYTLISENEPSKRTRVYPTVPGNDINDIFSEQT